MSEPQTNSTAIAGSSPVPCSPSSDTPETDAATHLMVESLHRYRAVVDADFCEKMERERDALRAAGVEIIEAARRSMPRKHGTIERNAKLFIPENSTAQAPIPAPKDL